MLGRTLTLEYFEIELLCRVHHGVEAKAAPDSGVQTLAEVSLHRFAFKTRGDRCCKADGVTHCHQCTRVPDELPGAFAIASNDRLARCHCVEYQRVCTLGMR